MTTASEALELAQRHHVTVTVDGGKLKLHAPEKPPGEVLSALQEHKQEIIAALTPRYSPMNAIAALYGRRVRQDPERAPLLYEIAALSVQTALPCHQIRGSRDACGQCARKATTYFTAGQTLYWVCSDQCASRSKATLWQHAADALSRWGIDPVSQALIAG